MNKKEANDIAYYLSELIELPGEGVPSGILQLHESLLKCSKLYRVTYTSWKTHRQDSNEKTEEYDRRMTEHFGKNWCLLKSISTPEGKAWSKNLWAEIAGE